jgi:hypothetical protein
MSEHADEKWGAYADTVLEFLGPPVLRIDLRDPVRDEGRAALAALGLERPFAVFTAENPDGANAEDAPAPAVEERKARENERRQSALERALVEAAIPFALVDGVAPDGSYREHCVAAVMPREAAAALAERLRQLALFWWDGGSFWLLPGKADEEPERLPRP